MFVDTHCHMNMMVKKKFDTLLSAEQLELVADVIKEAERAGVTGFINVGTSVPESINSVQIAQKYKQVYATVGIHPCDASESWRKDFDEIKKLTQNKEENKVVGIGEIGLDFYHKPFFIQRQKDVFKAQIELALEHELPLMMHVREAGEEFLRVLEEYTKEIKGGVVHCFCQDADFAKVAISWGLYVGIDGPIGYPKNEALREVVRGIPLENIIIETDSPFLPPQAYRGKPNKPAYIPLFAPLLAELKNVSVEELARVTTKNAEKLFNVSFSS